MNMGNGQEPVRAASTAVEVIVDGAPLAQAQVIADIVQRVVDWSDRTSPPDWPEALIVTADELTDLLREAVQIGARASAAVARVALELDERGRQHPLSKLALDDQPLAPAQLAAIQARADAVPPGPWTWWTSNSWRRLSGPDGRDGGVLYPTVSRSDGHPDLVVSEEVMNFIAAAREDVPALLAHIAAQKAELDQLRKFHGASAEARQRPVEPGP